jgi:hypothetical protein
LAIDICKLKKPLLRADARKGLFLLTLARKGRFRGLLYALAAQHSQVRYNNER